MAKLKTVPKHKWDTVKARMVEQIQSSKHDIDTTEIILDDKDLNKLKKVGHLDYDEVTLVYSK